MKTILWIIMCALCVSKASAKELKIAVGSSIPPYIIQSENRGIEYDILKETLELAGYRMKARYVPLARKLAEFRAGRMDGIMSTGLENLPGCYTNSHITYRNYAITLKSNGLEINSIGDLKDKRVIAFQNASNYLGQNFKELAKNNGLYREIGDQNTQSKMLFTRRADVIIADKYIFQWFSRNLANTNGIENPEVTYHELFPPSHFRSVFAKQEVCDKFNVALKKIKKSGRYDEIVRSYGVTVDSDALVN
ncbi:hypothetical protein WH96_06525 [Kiloniella spongiae]|uniref:Uncharacterized protein n=1 Tax=Kiloniella spongiae TaxID=1489064 RepID=A0A0H2MKL8_9PROT|nr:transporter substrate-binding domain-containing protein [Kiloniella spongiae]KLN61302.1 hypothetical protein WH96_06525 [Kiloniella spongiae]